MDFTENVVKLPVINFDVIADQEKKKNVMEIYFQAVLEQ